MSRKSQTTRRSVLTATGAFSLLGLAGVASGNASSDDGIPVPDDADERTYPTIGTNADAPTATFYGNFKCPYSQEFVSGNLEEIVSEFVTAGRLNVEFCNLAYEPGNSSQHFISDSDPRLAAVGLAVWDEDPDSYWQFVSQTYANSPSGYVGYDELEDRARTANVTNAETCIERAQAGEYDAAVERVAELAGTDGISFTPQLELAGDTTAPHHGTQAVIDWIEARLEDAPDGEKSEDKVEDEADETETDADEVEEPQEKSDVEDEADDADADDEADVDEDYDDDGETVEDGEEVDDGESDEEDVEADDSDANDGTDADDDADADYDEDDDDDGGSTSSGSSGSSGGIGAGDDYDLSSDRTVDDLPVDC